MSQGSTTYIGGCALVLTLYSLAITTNYLYIYFIIFSPHNLMSGSARRCHGICPNPHNTSIPRILHHTWRDQRVPEKWRSTYQACVDQHSGWQHILWTHSAMEKFLEREYPWFLPTYHSYPYTIQKVDATRYFLLYHYGGVYVDLDVGCNTSTTDIIKGGLIIVTVSLARL